jgi:hypothetical protein
MPKAVSNCCIRAAVLSVLLLVTTPSRVTDATLVAVRVRVRFMLFFLCVCEIAEGSRIELLCRHPLPPWGLFAYKPPRYDFNFAVFKSVYPKAPLSVL